MKSLFICLLLWVSTAAAQAPLGKLLTKTYPFLQAGDQTLVLISFKDRGSSKMDALRSPESLVSERSLRRRTKVLGAAHAVGEQDLPLDQTYVGAVAARVTSVRHQLKWFNAVSAMATKGQIDDLRNLPFVREVELVGRWRVRHDDEQPTSIKDSPSLRAPSGTTTLDYGTSFPQVNQINVPAVHDLGFYGQGVVIGVFDNGFRNLAHQAFDSMHIIATYDFVDHKVGVAPNNLSTTFGSHGVWTLSTIGGFRPGSLIGPAFKAKFILARTENDSSETPIEEDNWAAAIQWADSIGVDVTSTSLGYLGFDSPYPSLTWADMNGHTALITNAADRAVGLGIVVVNSAGNEGFNATQNTLIAPADGDSVITAGAVTTAGARTSFSSVGPTTDNPPRIKPDVMADGSGVKTASAADTITYVNVSGTSFSCPLSAGVAALILCANPSLTPMQVREAMRQTANNACAPNNLMGWGILNALAAVKYFTTPPGAISGIVFNDINGNGSKDPGEPGLANVKVKLTCTAVESTLTDLSGSYSFDSLRPGPYTIQSVVPAGWTVTVPLTGSYSVTLDSANTTAAGRVFGHFRLGSIQGVKFNDFNRDSTLDSGETGLAGWVIQLDGPQTLRTTTDSTGIYRFSGLGPGVYTVQESTVTSWVQTHPGVDGSYILRIRSGLDTTGLDFGNYYAPPNGYPVAAGWNLLSLPQDPPDHHQSVLYPTAVSRAFSFTGTGGYAVLDSIPNGAGYWIKFGSPQTVPIPGSVRTLDSVNVSPGWNLIGTLSIPVGVTTVTQEPDSNLTSPFFSYHGSYFLDDSLRPHDGYFVRVRGAGKLVLKTTPGNSPVATSGSRPFMLKGNLDESSNSITVRDSKGGHQSLYFGNSGFLLAHADLLSLPPLPPEDALDVRFSGGSLAWIPRSGDAENAASIEIRGAAYPLHITWNLSAPGADYTLAEGSSGRSTELTPGGMLTVKDPGITVLRLRGSRGTADALPKEYGLDQNYPNPFNPTTSIEYRLPADGRVKLEIFNLIGGEVRTLVDKVQQAGTYTVGWDGRSSEGFDLTSGIYFVRLTVTGPAGAAFTSTKKTILMR